MNQRLIGTKCRYINYEGHLLAWLVLSDPHLTMNKLDGTKQSLYKLDKRWTDYKIYLSIAEKYLLITFCNMDCMIH